MWELNTLSRQNKSDNKRHQQDKKVSWNAAYNLFIDTSSAVRQKQKEHFGFYVIHLPYMDFSSSPTESLRCYLRCIIFSTYHWVPVLLCVLLETHEPRKVKISLTVRSTISRSEVTRASAGYLFGDTHMHHTTTKSFEPPLISGLEQ